MILMFINTTINIGNMYTHSCDTMGFCVFKSPDQSTNANFICDGNSSMCCLFISSHFNLYCQAQSLPF